MEIKFSYLKLVNHEPDCIFGISSNLIVGAERLLELNLLSPKNMERNTEISSSGREFDFT